MQCKVHVFQIQIYTKLIELKTKKIVKKDYAYA